MSVVTGPLAAPPAAPGSITSPPGARTFLLYLDSLSQWGTELRQALGSLDRRAAVSSTPDDFTADLVLALSLSESIERRTAELTTTWDSGRVGPNELAHIAQLIWSRLPDALGNPSAFTLSEATTLASALEARLAARLDADSIAGSGAADRIAPLRETLARCRILSQTLGRHGGEPDELMAELEGALAGTTGPAALGAEISRIADAAELLERDLIKETSLRSTVELTAARLTQRLTELQSLETRTRADAVLCREKIADAPNLAVPDVDALGPVPAIPDGSQAPGSWTAVRAELDTYSARVELVARALAEASRRFTAPLTERAELRGLADAYRAKSAAAGLIEDPALDQAYQRARAVLWSAPCDLAAATPLVEAYSQAVQAATRPRIPQPGADK
ncbi:MAG: hypothetical protein JWM76_2714 [Pseudonocardiales bacterium]|nr:hypothetical protein [Pseudonocardiales bacterium]